MFALTLLFLISECVLVSSYLVTHLLFLRGLAVLAFLGFATAALVAGLHNPGMITMFLFAIANIIINAYHMSRLFYFKLPERLPPELQDIYTEQFAEYLAVREFLALVKITSLQTVENQSIIEQGKYCNVVLLLSGTAHVIVNGTVINKVRRGAILGEISYLTRKEAAATVMIPARAVIRVWDRNALRQFGVQHPEIILKFKEALILSLARKLIIENIQKANASV